MSLPGLALLITATGALREAAQEQAALEGDAAWLRVEMMPHEHVEGMEGTSKILAATFVGDEVHQIEARRWFQGQRKIELAVQVLLPPLATITIDGVTAKIDSHKGAGAYVAETAVHRLIELALGSAPKRPEPAGGSWGELYRDLVTQHASEFNGLPFLATTKNGVDLAAVDYSIELHTIASPRPGDVAAQTVGFWADLVAKMRTDPHVSDMADFVAGLIRGHVRAPWQVDRTAAGLSGQEAEALGLGPFAGLDDEPDTVALSIVSDLGTTRVTPEEAP